jgi:hypothetical protein
LGTSSVSNGPTLHSLSLLPSALVLVLSMQASGFVKGTCSPVKRQEHRSQIHQASKHTSDL